MKYSELSTEERDRLVHEKVMGKPLACVGELKFKVERNPFDIGPLHSDEAIEWNCIACGAQGGCLQNAIPKEHAPRIPHYSTDMNAAWQIVRQMNKPQDECYDRYGRFIEELERLIGSNLLFDALNTEKGNASYAISTDSIAIAALKAVGVEIEP